VIDYSRDYNLNEGTVLISGKQGHLMRGYKGWPHFLFLWYMFPGEEEEGRRRRRRKGNDKDKSEIKNEKKLGGRHFILL